MNFHLKRASILAKLLDSQFQFWKWRFGLDPILGLIPIVGDILPIGLAFYIVWIAKQYDLPTAKIYQMIFNIGLDLIFGLMPILGDLFDFGFKSNSKNLKILEDHLKQTKLKTHKIVEG